MGRSVLSVMKEVLKKDPLTAALKKLESFYASHTLTLEQQEWVKQHRAKHDAEERSTTIRYAREELEYLKNDL